MLFLSEDKFDSARVENSTPLHSHSLIPKQSSVFSKSAIDSIRSISNSQGISEGKESTGRKLSQVRTTYAKNLAKSFQVSSAKRKSLSISTKLEDSSSYYMSPSYSQTAKSSAIKFPFLSDHSSRHAKKRRNLSEIHCNTSPSHSNIVYLRTQVNSVSPTNLFTEMTDPLTSFQSFDFESRKPTLLVEEMKPF